MSHSKNQRAHKIPMTNLLSKSEKLTFVNLMKPSKIPKIGKLQVKTGKLPEINLLDSSPSSLTSRNFANSFYERKRTENSEIFFKKEQNLAITDSKSRKTTNFPEFFTVSDLQKPLKTPKTTRSTCKSEDFYVKFDTKSANFDAMSKLKEKYLKIMGLKTEINSLDFKDSSIKSLITHSFAIGMILVEKALNKTILFEEEQQTFSNLCEMLWQMSEILSSFQMIFSRISAENEQLLQKINELSENVRNLQLERERHELSIDTFSSSSFKNLLKTNNADPTLTNFINNLHNKFDFEKQKLLSENEKLRVLARTTQHEDKLRQLEREIKQITESSARTISEIKSDNEFLSNKIMNLEFTSQSQKNLIKNYEQELSILREKLIEQEKKSESLSQTNRILEEQKTQDRETLSMQYEEIFSIKLGFEDKMDIVKRVKENYFSIQNKLNTLTRLNELPKNEDFQENFQLLSEISHYFQAKPFAKSLSSQIYAKSGVQAPDFGNINENIEKTGETLGKKTENLDSIHAVELAKYHYYQPTFFTLIESKFKQYEISVNKTASKPDAFSVISETISRSSETHGDFLLPSTFIATLRGILDSKWHEFAYFAQIKSFSKFPEFVYSWLGKFEVKLENRTVVPSITQDPDEDRCQFLKNLVHPLVDKHWESITFREFLEEKSSLDEVYFYLYCRFLLFKGPQLAHSQGKFCFVHYINFDAVNEIIETVFKNFEEETLSFLKKKLKSKAKIKNNNVLVDSGFVLRVFLEYYRLERKHRFKLLQELFLIKAQSKMYVKYEEFKQILDAFQTNITDLEKAQLYRECYNVGRGKIDPEVIFVVLTENNFFIYTVKTRLSSTLFNDSSNMNNFEENNNKIINDYFNLEGKLFDVTNIAGGWGLENLLLELQNYHKIFKKQTQTDNAAFQTKNLLYSYLKLHETLMSIRNYEIFTKNFQKIIKQEEILKTELFFYENVYNFVYKIKNREIINEMELNSKAKIIQKWVQNRFSRWLKLLYTIFKVKIHRSKISHSVSSVSKSQIKDKKN